MNMENFQLWKLILEALRALIPYYEPIFQDFTTHNGLDSHGLGWLLAAITFEPDAITPTGLQIRTPYTAVETFRRELKSIADEGFFIETKPDDFLLTPSAREQTVQLIDAGRIEMDKADPLPHSESKRVSELLSKLVQGMLGTPPPPDIWSVGLSCKLLPDKDPPLPYTEQLVSCLNSYRDDSHIAAWQPSGLSAMAIEALTFLWRGDATSLDALFEKLTHRGYPREVYAKSLEELREHGYLEGANDALHLTTNGKSFRKKIEHDTDQYFFAPWVSLRDQEKEELTGLLIRLRDGLQVKIIGGKSGLH